MTNRTPIEVEIGAGNWSGNSIRTRNGAAGDVVQSHLCAAYAAALELELPVAVWRQPRSSSYRLLVSLESPVEQTPDFTCREAGFHLAPFSDRHVPLFLPAHLLLTIEDESEVPHLSRADDLPQHLHPIAERWLAAFRNQLTSPSGSENAWYLPERARSASADQSLCQVQFEELVQSAIDFINEEQIAKVVVSRTVSSPLPDGFHPVRLFGGLCARYAHAFVSLVALPGVGTWIGASPELLLALDDKSLRTMALAGTQPRPDTTVPAESVHWGEKELVEQELVSEYVRAFFNDAGYPAFEEVGPRTVTAGKVFHLQSAFRIALPEEKRLALANRVLTELHPTSAVCGMPRREALSFILQEEGYDRAYYSGYLGPVFIGDQSTLYVNLRCMQLDRSEARLYVGGGITAASDPASEWLETEVKSHTILDVLREAGEPDGTTGTVHSNVPEKVEAEKVEPEKVEPEKGATHRRTSYTRSRAHRGNNELTAAIAN